MFSYWPRPAALRAPGIPLPRFDRRRPPAAHLERFLIGFIMPRIPANTRPDFLLPESDPVGPPTNVDPPANWAINKREYPSQGELARFLFLVVAQ